MSFGWDRLSRGHGGRSRGGDLQKQKQKTREGEEREGKSFVEGKKRTSGRIYIGKKFVPAMTRRRALRSGETWLRSGVRLYVAAYPRVG